MTVSTKEEEFHSVSAVLDREKDQILSGIPERDRVDVMCGVIELIEEHNGEQMKYILGKMCLEMTHLSTSLRAIQGESELQQTLQQILPDRVERLAVVEHELLQMQIQLDEVQKENTMLKHTNTQLADNLEDAKTRLVEINYVWSLLVRPIHRSSNYVMRLLVRPIHRSCRETKPRCTKKKLNR